MIKIIEHNDTGETKVMGVDCQPYSSNTCGAPDDIVDAVYAGFGLNLPDFDFRNTEWR